MVRYLWEKPTGCSLNIVFFPKIFKYSGLCFPSVSVCVHTHQAGRTPALQQNWQSSEKPQNFKEKTQYLMNTLQIQKRKNNWMCYFTKAPHVRLFPERLGSFTPFYCYRSTCLIDNSARSLLKLIESMKLTKP